MSSNNPIRNYLLASLCACVILAIFNPAYAAVADSDGDGISDDLEEVYGSNPNLTDSDGDGVPDNVEADTTGNAPDTDGDGIADIMDEDDDNDGLMTFEEATTDASGAYIDSDGDGIPNYLDPDSDNDTVPDNIDPAGADTDGDGIFDIFDPDDDGDGIPTAIEYPRGDTDGDGIADYLDPDDDNDGVPSLIDPDPLDPNDGPNGDLDGDGITNSRELELGSDPNNRDTDGDGLFDGTEAPGGEPLEIVPGCSQYDLLNPDDDCDGVPTRDETNEDANGDGERELMNTDGDTHPDHRDRDDDGDGLPTLAELPQGNTDGDIHDNYVDADDDGDCLLTRDEGSSDGDGDGLPNYLDVDSDNDGVGDRIEGNSATGAGPDRLNPAVQGDDRQTCISIFEAPFDVDDLSTGFEITDPFADYDWPALEGRYVITDNGSAAPQAWSGSAPAGTTMMTSYLGIDLATLPNFTQIMDMANDYNQQVRAGGNPQPPDIDALAVDAQQAVVKQIYWTERGDKPCHLDVGLKGVEGPMLNIPSADQSIWRFDNCVQSGGLPIHALKHIPSNHYIGGLKVCQNSAGTRLKGIEVQTFTMSPVGGGAWGIAHRFDETPLYGKKQTNCATWGTASSCPAYTVPVGLWLRWHRASSTAPAEIAQLALQCNTVVDTTKILDSAAFE